MSLSLNIARIMERLRFSIGIIATIILALFFLYKNFGTEKIEVTAQVISKEQYQTTGRRSRTEFLVATDKGAFHDERDFLIGKFRGHRYYDQLQVGKTYRFLVLYDRRDIVYNQIIRVSGL